MRVIIFFNYAVLLGSLGLPSAAAQTTPAGVDSPGEILTASHLPADSARNACLELGPSRWSPAVHQSGKCRVRGCSAAGRTPGRDWVACEYERHWVLPASDSNPADTVLEIDLVLYGTGRRGAGRDAPAEHEYTLVWHEVYEPEVLRTVTPTVTPVHGGRVLLSVEECLNGTGGCMDSFLLERDGKWRPVRLVFLDSLARRYPGAVRHGFHVNPRTLTAFVAIYSDTDPNCCPSRSAVIALRLRGDSLEMKTIRIERE